MTDRGDSVPTFDRMELVCEYHSTLVKLSRATNPKEREELETILVILRNCWKALTGVDNLHELARPESNAD